MGYKVPFLGHSNKCEKKFFVLRCFDFDICYGKIFYSEHSLIIFNVPDSQPSWNLWIFLKFWIRSTKYLSPLECKQKRKPAKRKRPSYRIFILFGILRRSSFATARALVPHFTLLSTCPLRKIWSASEFLYRSIPRLQSESVLITRQ